MADEFEPPTIRTMKTDAEELLKQEKGSFLEMFEREKGAGIPRLPRRAPKRNYIKIFAVSFFILAVLGSATLGGYLYYLRQNPDTSPQQLTPPRSFLNAERSEIIKVRKNDRMALLGELKEKKAKPPQDDYLYLPVIFLESGDTQSLATPQDFFTSLKIQLPTALANNLTGKWNMYLTSGALVFIFEVSDYLKAQGTMFSWEKTLQQDLSPLLAGIEPGFHSFEDLTVHNIDLRRMKLSASTDVALAHSIMLGKYLIIATSDTSAQNTIERLLIAGSNIQ